MNLQDFSWDMSTCGSEECIESTSIMNKRPFMSAEDEQSDEFVEPQNQENPFCGTGEQMFKHGRIIFKNKVLSLENECWSKKLHRTRIRPAIVRSAPLLKENYMDELDNGEIHTLPTLGHGKSDSIKRISAEVAASLVLKHIERDYLFVDARFSYEYNGGHIKGAVNIRDEEIVKKLLDEPKLLIFYCEFSSVRGPKLAAELRNLDRQTSLYPTLKCPEIYILEGGYSNFYKQYPGCCDPVSYIRMHDTKFAFECSNEYKKKKNRKN